MLELARGNTTVKLLSVQARYSKNLKKNAPYRKLMSVEHVRHNILIAVDAVDTLSNTAESEKTNKLIDDPERDVH